MNCITEMLPFHTALPLLSWEASTPFEFIFSMYFHCYDTISEIILLAHNLQFGSSSPWSVVFRSLTSHDYHSRRAQWEERVGAGVASGRGAADKYTLKGASLGKGFFPLCPILTFESSPPNPIKWCIRAEPTWSAPSPNFQFLTLLWEPNLQSISLQGRVALHTSALWLASCEWSFT